MFLQMHHIANKVLAADVAQFLKVVFVGQVAAEPLARLVVAILGAETALTIMAGQFVQLTHQGQIEVERLFFIQRSRCTKQIDDYMSWRTI